MPTAALLTARARDMKPGTIMLLTEAEDALFKARACMPMPRAPYHSLPYGFECCILCLCQQHETVPA